MIESLARTTLTVLFALVPGVSWAEVCDKMMPEPGSSGGALEFLVSFFPLLTVATIAAVALYVDKRGFLFGAAAVALAVGALAIVSLMDPFQVAARAEGCRSAESFLPLIVIGLLSMFLVMRALRKRRTVEGKP